MCKNGNVLWYKISPIVSSFAK